MTTGDIFAIIYCILSLGTLTLLPISIFIVTYFYSDHLESDAKLGKFSMLFTDLNRDSKSQIVYHAIFFIKRFLLSIILVFFRESGNLQLILIEYISMTQIIYMVKSKPFIEESNNRNDIMNELVLIQVCVISQIFSDESFDSDATYNMGYIYILIISINMCVNLKSIVYQLYVNSVLAFYKARGFIRSYRLNKEM